MSTRLAFKVLSEVYNYDPEEVAANPVHLFIVLKRTIYKERFNQDRAEAYLAVIKKYLEPEYLKTVIKDFQVAYIDCYEEFLQSTMDNYLLWADHWTLDNDFRDPDTGQMFDRGTLNEKLEQLEKPAGIANPKEFRNDIVQFALRYQARHKGKNISWKAYSKLREVIEANMFNKMEDLLPIITFNGHKSKEDAEKHAGFVDRMKKQGYTEKQVKIIVSWAMRMQKQ